MKLTPHFMRFASKRRRLATDLAFDILHEELGRTVFLFEIKPRRTTRTK